jgi:LysM repeat protein
MARKKSLLILITAFIFMALVISGCRQSYAPLDESLATPTVEGGAAFPEELPADMEGVFEAGAQTATAEAIAALPGAEEPTAVPAAGGDTELTPEGETPTEAVGAADTTTETETPTATLPVVADATETPVPTNIPSVDVNNLPSSYTLKKGEFPYCIARRFNVDPSELLSLNGISSAASSSLQPGLTLKIPQTGKSFPYDRARNNHPVTYVVPETTTVYSIACFFGDVDPAKIVSLNSISNPDSVAAGTSLQIP